MLVFAVFMTSCSTEETTKKKKKTKKTTTEITSTEVPDTEPSEVPTSTDEPGTSLTETEPSVSIPDKTESSEVTFSKDGEVTSSMEGPIVQIGPHEFAPYEYVKVDIEDQEILNKDGLSIHVNGYKLGIGTTRDLLMHIENQTGHPVKLSSQLLRINGFEEADLFIKYFDDHASEDFEYEFYISLGDEIGLWDPEKIELSFSVEYTDTQEQYVTELLPILTSLYDENTYNESADIDFSHGVPLYDDGKIRVIAIDYKIEDYGDAKLIFYIENNTDVAMMFQKEELLVNGVDAPFFIFRTVQAHSKSIETMYFYESTLKENNIDRIRNISLILKISEDGNYTDKTLTDPLTISVE